MTALAAPVWGPAAQSHLARRILPAPACLRPVGLAIGVDVELLAG